MKKYLIIALLMITPAYIHAQAYLHLEGKIGDYPASMELLAQKPADTMSPVISSNRYNGCYYYHSQDKPIYLYAQDSLNGGEMVMVVYAEHEQDNEYFKGALFAGGIYKGTWTRSGQSLPFEFTGNSKVSTPMNMMSTSKKFPSGLQVKEKDAASPESKAEITFCLPADPMLRSDLIKQVSDNKFSTLEDFEKDIFMTEESNYKADVEGVTAEDDPYYFLNYEMSRSLYPVINNESYLVMNYSTYDYQGGAHGFSTQTFYTYDKRKQRWLEIADVLNLKFERQINYALDQEVRKEYNIPQGIALSEGDESIFLADSITYSPNFTLDKKGITFHYGLYEMTPYAMGFFDFFLPYDKIRQYMNPGFRY